MGSRSPYEKGQFWEEGFSIWTLSTVNCAKRLNRSSEMSYGTLDAENHALDGAQIPHGKGQF